MVICINPSRPLSNNFWLSNPHITYSTTTHCCSHNSFSHWQFQFKNNLTKSWVSRNLPILPPCRRRVMKVTLKKRPLINKNLNKYKSLKNNKMWNQRKVRLWCLTWLLKCSNSLTLRSITFKFQTNNQTVNQRENSEYLLSNILSLHII